MIELSVAVAVLVGGVIGYFGRRFVEKSASGERVSHVTKLVELKAKMDQSGMDLEDVKDFENRVFFNRPRLRQLEDAVEKVVDPNTPPDVATRLSQDFQISGLTQADMNQSAYNSLVGAEALLKTVFDELGREMAADQFESLRATQENWAKYAHGQASLTASLVAGGSMQPMIYASERERLTAQRYAELRDYLDSRKL
ncbi:lysozyme inhibitor LprI family protein [Mesorhizobium sp.]|uniref:lysozyme inhibitor LprI family protein n=1 Tax=Mesorhizobium sp. TaxID=1871066 RepID=UPI0025B85530|nr:lysozyme inhibitor LprI family protein [Mesorhizobium sp.]